MEGFLTAAASALWLGILTSISPCPLATNIAAISFIGRRVSNPRRVFFTGLLYALGRIAAYVVLGIIIVASLLSSSEISLFLQKYLNRVLGPILILVGMVLLELIPLRLPGGGFGDGFQRRAERFGMWGAAVLGFVFALSFCPLSAALFFGSLIPLYLLFFRVNDVRYVAWACLLIVIALVAVRYNAVVPDLAAYNLEGLDRAFINRRLSTAYSPNLYEWLVSLWVVSLWVVVFLLGTRWLPVISPEKGGEQHVS